MNTRSRSLPTMTEGEAATVPGAAPSDTEPAVIPGVTGDRIELESYAPNRLVYSYSTETDRLAVFSEIWYPDGWNATVDGQPLPLLRADWTLRAALLPAGTHRLDMYFLPESYRLGAAISRWSSLLLLLLLLGAAIGPYLLPRK